MAEDREDELHCEFTKRLSKCRALVQGLGRLRREPLHRVLLFKEREPELFRNSVRAPPSLSEVLLHSSSPRRERIASKSRLRRQMYIGLATALQRKRGIALC